MKLIDDIQKLGYSIEVAQEGGEFYAHPETGSPVEREEPGAVKSSRPSTYRVTGHGIDIHVNEGDRDAWKSIVEGHDERLTQAGETHEETLARIRPEGE